MEKVGVFSFLLDPGHKDQKKKSSWSWKRAAKGAAVGSMFFFLTIGLTLVAPPAGLAILTNWAWVAATGAIGAGFDL